MEKIEKLERRYAYLRIAMIVLIIAYIHKAGQTIWEYIWHPEIYTDPTMPWYMTMLISGAVIAVVSLIFLCFIAKTKRKMDLLEEKESKKKLS